MIRRIFCGGSFFVALTLGYLGVTAPVRAADPGDFAETDPSGRTLDVTGRLKPNSQPGSSAPYVLVDKWGAILYQVQLPPGMTLDRYLNQTIHLRGNELESADPRTPILEIKGIEQSNQAAPPAMRSRAQPMRRVAQAAYREPANDEQDDDASLNESLDTALSRRGRVERASYNQGEPTPAGDPDQVGDMQGNVFQGNSGDGCGLGCDGGCDQCGGCGCAACCSPCGPAGQYWARAEYLYWWTEGMRVPPLVTTGPSAAQPGYLNTAGTTILFGGDRVNDFGRSGVRLTLGGWIDQCHTLGVEGEYFILARASTNYSATSNGTPILSRPFFDVSPSAADPSQIVGENVEQVASPGAIAGTVTVNTQTELQSAGIRMLINLCCSDQCSCNPCCPTLSGPSGHRIDFLVGYRYMQLRDGVSINENLTSLETANPGSFLVNDSFNTQNTFNGVELGGVMKRYQGRWSLDLLGKLALGNNYEVVNINGSTVTTQNGTSTTSQGGLLALSSNIGRYTRDEFAVVPELGATLGFQLTPHLRATFGYSFVYWSQVARAGDQINLNVNSRLLPNDTRTLAGDTRQPSFAFQTTDFWAQGINTGLELRW